MPKSKNRHNPKTRHSGRPSTKRALAKEQKERKSLAIWLSVAAIGIIIGMFFYLRRAFAKGGEVHIPIGSGGIIIILAVWSVYDWWRNRSSAEKQSQHAKRKQAIRNHAQDQKQNR